MSQRGQVRPPGTGECHADKKYSKEVTMSPCSVNSGAWILHHGQQRGDQQHEGDQPRDAQVEGGLHADHAQGHPGRDFLTNICRPDV